MLSVLSSGTLSLSEELGGARAEALRLTSENTQLHDLLSSRRRLFHSRMGSVARFLFNQEDYILKAAAFSGLMAWRSQHQIHVGNRREKVNGIASHRKNAWLWLWRKKLFSLWRRTTSLGQRNAEHERGEHRVAEQQAHNDATMGLLMESRCKIQSLEAVLDCERKRVAELSSDLAQARAQVADLQATLKDSYMRQFEEASQRQTLEQHFSNLVSDMTQLRSEHETLNLEISHKREELARCEVQHSEHEKRLHEASGELSLAEEVIDDITSSKLVGLQRFFSKYNLPGVVTALFRKVLELQGKTRARGCMTTFTQSQSSIGSGASSPTTSPLHSSPSAPVTFSPLVSEVRNYLTINKDGTVSRISLHTYIEGLHLQVVSASMVTQVILALLDLDLGEGPCDVHRFIAALSSPPPWAQLDFATALWGSVGEPAAAVVQQHRRNVARSNSGTMVNARKAMVTSPRSSLPSPRSSPKTPLAAR
mmetsp:Transcript_150938/g.267060  ORF Transcript_150938/g.267060 Transcript_150938/m.267060 type:complete len:480 (-) Transcript_150938:144-1583(-)